MRRFVAILFSSALLMAMPASAVAGNAHGKTGKAVKGCNVGVVVGGGFTCVL